MQHTCSIHATYMQRACSMLRTCDIHSACMQQEAYGHHMCSTPATLCTPCTQHTVCASNMHHAACNIQIMHAAHQAHTFAIRSMPARFHRVWQATPSHMPFQMPLRWLGMPRPCLAQTISKSGRGLASAYQGAEEAPSTRFHRARKAPVQRHTTYMRQARNMNTAYATCMQHIPCYHLLSPI